MGPVRTATSATLSTVVAIMPVFLLGASGVLVREDLGFDEAGLGMSVAVFMGANAVSSTVGGRLAERFGAGQAMVLASISSAAVMLGLAVLAHSLTHVMLLLAVAGVGNGVAQPAANMAIARGVVVRPALVFGVKQSAIPLATLLAGASVPLIGLTAGWRWGFALGAAFAAVVAVLVPRRIAPAQVRHAKRMREGDSAVAPLVALAMAAGVGTAAAVSFGSFFVESVVAGGIAASTAGWLLVVGSVAGIVARLVAGWMADRYRGRALHSVTAMLVLGAGGYWMLGLGGPVLLTLGTLLAYACGWGWTGLLMFETVRLNPNAPAAATGIIQSGAASGATLGPLLFGYIVTTSSFQAAWFLAAGAALISAALMLASRAWLVFDQKQRTTT